METNARAFAWYGPLGELELRAWLATRSLHVPADLFEVWITLGPGEMFESEELLAPFGAPDYALHCDDTNVFHRGRGMPAGLFLFHEGTWLSAVRQCDSRYVTLDRHTYAVVREFPSLLAWYVATVRSEFARRYGVGARLA
jgi:hypothetical protein